MRFLAIDHGDKRTGLAVSDAAETLATPHAVLATENQQHLIDSIVRLVKKESIEAIVVGLPLNMDDTEGPRTRRVRAFADKLSVQVDVPIHFHDERLSSFSAESMFVGADLTRKDKKKRLDAVAAAAILQSFLDTRQTQSAPTVSPTVVCVADADALADRAALEFAAAAQEAVKQRGAFYVAVSGGKTPKRFFQRLAMPDIAERISWDNTHLFWADERCVPPDSSDSNYKLARETFIDAVGIPAEQIYRVRGDDGDPLRAADVYEATLMTVFDLQDNQWPSFDLVALGLGQDGHIASLLPGEAAVSIDDRLTWPVYHETQHNRITLTVPVLQNARKLMVLVAGEDKAEIVGSLFSTQPDPHRYPAYVLWPVMDRVLWLLDAPAAGQLNLPDGVF